jgi:DNA-binding NtrC family response regulator
VLEHYSWPGNIRELRNVMERAVLLCTDGTITLDHLPVQKMRATLAARPAPVSHSPTSLLGAVEGGRGERSTADSIRKEMEALERQRIVEMLERCGGNQTQAAKNLGISRRTLVNRIEAYDIPRPRKGRDED